MKILYRISEMGNPKNKPSYVNPKNVFLHFIRVFRNYEIYVIADNVSDDLYQFLCCVNANKERVIRTSLNNSGAFMYAVNYAINNFNDDDAVYFAEDDYVYTKTAPIIIEEGLRISDYSSGYDHPDKYINYAEGGPNPHISGGGELSRVLMTSNSHWKYTNSCCMTFATTVKILKEDLDIYAKHCSGKCPGDFGMFTDLVQGKKRTLVSAIPSVSTHGETAWLAKLIDWEKEINN
jgi:hypothetical protein